METSARSSPLSRTQFSLLPTTGYLRIPHTTHQQIHIDEDTSIEIQPLLSSLPRLVLYHSLCVLTGGLFYLACRWMPAWRARFQSSTCSALVATSVLISTRYKELEIQPIVSRTFHGDIQNVFPSHGLRQDPSHLIRTFDYRHHRLIFNMTSYRFELLTGWHDPRWRSLNLTLTGTTAAEIQQRRQLFGLNQIDINQKSTFRLLVDEVLHPFFIFQIASIILWTVDNYLYYAATIFLISVASTAITLFETKQVIKKLSQMSKYTNELQVFRDNQWSLIDSHELVPGDVFELSTISNQFAPCDAVLLDGDCMLNESMLTGESIPVSKTAIEPSEMAHLPFLRPNISGTLSLSKNYIFAGTKLIRVRSGKLSSSSSTLDLITSTSSLSTRQPLETAIALVIKTGFQTEKGSLIRSMLFPRPHAHQLHRDAFQFIFILFIIAFCGFIYSTYNFILMGVGWRVILIRALDLITIVVPPALPATMSIGISFALGRLRGMKIFCISPPRINICGQVDVICFDKTGTLTQEGLDVLGFRYITQSAFQPPNFSPLERNLDLSITHNSQTAHHTILALTCCHALKQIPEGLIGDPLDLRMFEFTRHTLQEVQAHSPLTNHLHNQTLIRSPVNHAASLFPDDTLLFHQSPATSKILHTFEFSSALRRMSVIVHEESLQISTSDLYPAASPPYIIQNTLVNTFHCLTKGAPELVIPLCKPDTLPHNHASLLNEYTHHGYRVLALAHKIVETEEPLGMSREECERGLTFVGFVVFENKLKRNSAAVVAELNRAKIRQVMCTGDNVLTAISVSKECGIVDLQRHVYIPTLHTEPSLFSPPHSYPPSPSTLQSHLFSTSTLFPYSASPFSPNPTKHPHQTSLTWQEIDQESLTLNPNTLHPLSSPINLTTDYTLAITGDALTHILQHQPHLIPIIISKTQVYARMSPDDKHELVSLLQSHGRCVGFVGDGANDCGALKTADCGLSLSDAEASVAAPFTSQEPELDCVLTLIREGRAALVTSFSSFKFMALYSLIQFTSVSLMLSIGGSMNDLQFLFVDIVLTIPLATVMCYSKAFHKLDPRKPTGKLMSRRVLYSLFGQIVIQFAVQLMAFRYPKPHSWYLPPTPDPHLKSFKNFENTSVFLVSSYQYLICALVFSVGPPFREPLTKNGMCIARGFILVYFMIVVPALFVLTFVIHFSPPKFLLKLLGLVHLPSEAKLSLLALVIFNALVSFTLEAVILRFQSETSDASKRNRIRVNR